MIRYLQVAGDPAAEIPTTFRTAPADWTVRSLIKERFAVRITTQHKTAIFRQFNKETTTHRDALEFPDGQVVLLTRLSPDQEATVLQLPAEPRATEGEKKQEREPMNA